MPGFDVGTLGSVLFCNNVDFTGASPTAGTAQVTQNGQLLIGSAIQPNIQVGRLTSPNATITIGYASPNITLDVNHSDTFPWNDVSGVVTAASYNGYFVTGSCTSTLPASPAQGDTISYVVDTASTLTITAAGAQKIRVGSTVSAGGGTCANTAIGDSITLVYRLVDDTWFSLTGPQGTWSVT